METYTIQLKDCNEESQTFLKSKTEPDVVRALEVGVSVMNRVQASSDLDFVRAGLTDTMSRVTKMFGDLEHKYHDEIDRALTNRFDPAVATSYTKRFGDDIEGVIVSLKEIILNQVNTVRASLDRVEANTNESETSILGRAKKQIAETQAYIASQFDENNSKGFASLAADKLKQIDDAIGATIEKTISEKMRSETQEAMKPINESLVQIREALAEQKGRADVMEIASDKGFIFEDELFSQLQSIAAALGDIVEQTGLTKELSGSKKGDYLWMTTSKQLIVIEAKDKAVGQRESIEYMKKAIDARGAKIGILVVKSPTQFPKSVGRGNVYDNIMLCCADDIEIMIRMARIFLQMQNIQGDGINVGALQMKCTRIADEIKKFATVKTQLTNMEKSMTEGSTRISTVLEEVRKSVMMNLADMEDEISKTASKAA